MVRKHCLLIGIAIVGTLLLQSFCCWGETSDDSGLIEVIEQGTRQACARITSAKGRVTVNKWLLVGSPGSGIADETERVYDVAFLDESCRLSLDQVTYQHGLGNSDSKYERHEDIAIKGSTATYLTSINGLRAYILDTDPASGSRLKGIKHYAREVIPTWGALPSHGLYDLGRLALTLQKGRSVSSVIKRIVGRETVDGSSCVVVEIAVTSSSADKPNYYFHLWVDPNKGYTVPRYRCYTQGGPYKTRFLEDEEDVELKEYAPGIWHPVKAVYQSHGSDGLGNTWVTTKCTITWGPGFEINCPVSKADLALVIPSGTLVVDELLNTSYIAH